MAKLERTAKPISVIMEEIRVGEHGLPEIQRGYVWKADRVRDLIESLYKEYPCGMLLLWKPPQALLDNIQLRDFLISPKILNNKKPVFLILDGQQRLTSLLITRYGERITEYFEVKDEIIEKINRMDIYFNVKEEKFEIKSPKIKDQPFWISVTQIFEKGAIKVWQELRLKYNTVEENTMNEYLNRLDKIQKIKDYEMPIQILHTDDYSEITEAFIRINSKGMHLREAELALAKLALRLPGVVSNEFADALDEYEDKGFEFEARFLMRCFVAISTCQSRFKSLEKLWKSTEKELKDYWKKTKEGLDYAISFLSKNAGIESTDWITSVNSLVPLMFNFAFNKRLSTEQEKLLLFWYYSVNMWGRYSSSAETKLDQDIKALYDEELKTIKTNGIELLINNCRKDVSDLKVNNDEIIEVYQRSPFIPVLFAIIRKRNAKDWFSSIELSATNVGPMHSIEMHHIFPKALLKSNKFQSKEYDDLANIVFIAQKGHRSIGKLEPIVYIDKFNIEDERLISQFVPPDKELLKVENYNRFIKTRRAVIIKAMNEYLYELGGKHMDT